MHAQTKPATNESLSFVWLEITGKCQLECTHCYAASGPTGNHGSMSTAAWLGVIDQAAHLKVNMVQFIGGEPTLHPDLTTMVDHALGLGLEVEVFSNLVHVTPALWETFGQPGVRLACSYYSDDPKQHAAVTGRNTHARTKANIAEAVRRAIPLRVGVVGLHDDQRVSQAQAELAALGAIDVRVDRLREVGRGVRGDDEGKDQLCGNCTNGVLAIGPDGSVWPCVFSRWMPVGNVLANPLADVIASAEFRQTSDDLNAHFAARLGESAQVPCVPEMCDPQCGPSCSPACVPASNCGPVGVCEPLYR